MINELTAKRGVRVGSAVATTRGIARLPRYTARGVGYCARHLLALYRLSRCSSFPLSRLAICQEHSSRRRWIP